MLLERSASDVESLDLYISLITKSPAVSYQDNLIVSEVMNVYSVIGKLSSTVT